MWNQFFILWPQSAKKKWLHNKELKASNYFEATFAIAAISSTLWAISSILLASTMRLCKGSIIAPPEIVIMKRAAPVFINLPKPSRVKG